MPMSFPDMKSLELRAQQRGFRQPLKSETEADFRDALANYMMNIDRVESAEIRSGRGWDKMGPEEVLSGAFGLNLSSLMGDRTDGVEPKPEVSKRNGPLNPVMDKHLKEILFNGKED